ncbi:MAG TPA: hypothetical protein VGK74_07820 [Symbiobacteriaceae bacterium]
MGLLTDMMARIGRVHLPTLGDSMWPTICAGDTLEVLPIDEATGPQVGQVVVVACGPSRFAVQRVVARTDEAVILVGDNRLLVEAPTPVSDIFGRVTAVIRNGRRITLTEDLPFPTAIRELGHCAGIACVQVVHPGDKAAAAGLTALPPAEAREWVQARRQAGVPVLALAEQGRGDFRTLAHYVTHYPEVVLIAGLVSGYGCATNASLDPDVVTEAVRLPIASLADLPAWLESFTARIRHDAYSTAI